MDSINVDVAMFLHPMDIIKFLIDSSGRTTNTLLVKQFSDYLQGGDDMALTNKKILKSVTGKRFYSVSQKMFIEDMCGFLTLKMLSMALNIFWDTLYFNEIIQTMIDNKKHFPSSSSESD